MTALYEAFLQSVPPFEAAPTTRTGPVHPSQVAFCSVTTSATSADSCRLLSFLTDVLTLFLARAATGAVPIFRYVDNRELKVANDFKRLVEVLISFTRKAYNDVCSDCSQRNLLLD